MIHKTAIIDNKAKVSNSANIGPYSVIGPNVEIDSNGKLTYYGDYPNLSNDAHDEETGFPEFAPDTYSLRLRPPVKLSVHAGTREILELA